MGTIILLLIIYDDCINSILIVILFTSTCQLIEILWAYGTGSVIARMGQRLVFNKPSHQNLDSNCTEHMKQLFPSLTWDELT